VTASHDEAGLPKPGEAASGTPRNEPSSEPHDEPPAVGGELWRWQLVGDDAVLVDLPDVETVARVGEALRAAPPPGVVDVIPAATTVLVRGSARGRHRWASAARRIAEGSSGPSHVPDAVPADAAGDRSAGTQAAATGGAVAPGPPGARVVEIPVVYDGDDLADVARLAGLTRDEVAARHVAGRYRVAFGGFMPGFAYLTGLDPALVVPRLATPRTRVPAGAVAIAGEYAAVYPRATPGGWRLLGRTDTVMFDPAHDERPALLVPGDQVRFVPAREQIVARASDGADEEPRGVDAPPGAVVATPAEDEALAATVVATHAEDEALAATVVATPAANEQLAATSAVIEVLATGPLVLVEDAGRLGLAAVGVPRSGAADPVALRTANRLVGNRADAAVLEVVLGGLVVRFGATTAIALVGASLSAEIDGEPVLIGRTVRAPAGSTLELGFPTTGLRTWLAVRGGVDARPVLGSRSTDVLSALGPAPLAAGDVLPIGAAFEGLPEVARPVDEAALGSTSSSVTRTGDADLEHRQGEGHVVVLPATPGPRIDRLDDESRERLARQVWVVTADSNRVALRLDGPPLVRADDEELPSEGLVLGAVQVPHDGRPVVFGPDHPVTGGYPVVAVLTAEGITRMAQRRPGDRVRLAIR